MLRELLSSRVAKSILISSSFFMRDAQSVGHPAYLKNNLFKHYLFAMRKCSDCSFCIFSSLRSPDFQSLSISCCKRSFMNFICVVIIVNFKYSCAMKQIFANTPKILRRKINTWSFFIQVDPYNPLYFSVLCHFLVDFLAVSNLSSYFCTNK